MPEIGGNFEFFHTLPEKAGEFVSTPTQIHSSLNTLLANRGIPNLYVHQAQALELVKARKNIVVTTGTASGKTWCYNLPVLNTRIEDGVSRALYLFPTKALAQDQLRNLDTISAELFELSGQKIPVSVYDGDTPAHTRNQIRTSAAILLTNPDMLHIGILPHHTLWADFFENLRFVVVDEMHTYRGVFGSHVANLIRRLKRIAAFYGSYPQFILTSATIGNPVQLAQKLIELPIELIDQDGAPKGERIFLFYNPPITNSELGLRRSAVVESEVLASDLIDYQVQTIMFCRTRRTVENVVIKLQQKYPKHSRLVRGYRSGYLPAERREIEQDLRSGKTLAVAATNALELGINIGNLDCVILLGYPGTVAATIQQSGRAGRQLKPSLAIFLATNSPLDQFLISHPDYIFNRSPELALIDPNNLLILMQHLKCALFELPFHKNDRFGLADPEVLSGLLQIFEEERIAHVANQNYYWSADQYPANQISLRSASGNTIALQAVVGDRLQLIGEVDQASAMWMIHPHAVYIHEGQTFLVKELDIENNRALLLPHSDDFYTEPTQNVSIEVLNIIKSEEITGGKKQYGEVVVNSQVTGYQQIRWVTQERLAQESLEMPITHLRTTAFWISVSQDAVASIREKGLWKNDRNNYGSNWDHQRMLARERDKYTCQICGLIEGKTAHHVHHKIPFRQFTSSLVANELDNLITLCPSCHQKAETSVQMRSGLAGLSHLLQNLSPLYLMCDTGDLGVLSDPQASFSDKRPAIILYELIPGGVGLGEALFRLLDQVLHSALEQVKHCACKDGCPACVGTAGENGFGGKLETKALLQALLGLEIGND